MEANESNRLPARHIALGTISFAVCFALWGLASAFAPRFRAQLHLSATEGALLVAVPVLLGSLARIPMGMLADRLGGRAVFAALMIVVAIPAALVPEAGGYPALLAVAYFLGLAGSSFAVGVSYVSRWTPAAKQGTGLGIYGAGNTPASSSASTSRPSSPTARSARTCPAPSTTRKRAGRLSARATRGTSRPATDGCCRDRRRDLFRGSSSSAAATSSSPREWRSVGRPEP